MSVLEVALAFLIVGLSIVPILGLFTTSGQQARQTSDYGLAAALEGKVAEEMRLGVWENVHFVEALEQDPSYGVELPVIDGLSPFFAVIEDLAQPLGEITVRVDPGIVPAYGTLYRELSSFHLGLSSKETALVTGRALDVDLRIGWTDFQQQARLAELPVRLPRRQAVVPDPPQVLDRAKADEAIRGLLYPARAGRSLAQIAATAGADVESLRALGDVVVLAKAYAESGPASSDLIAAAQQAVATAANDRAKGRAQVALARILERKAALCLHLVCYLMPRLAQLAGSTPGSLGNPGPDRAACGLWLPRVRGIVGGFEQAIAQARDAYAVAWGPPLGAALPPRVRIRVFMKLLEAAKLAVLTVGPPDTRALAALVADFERLHAGHNPNFAQFARVEKTRLADVATLEASYPTARLVAARGFRNAVSQAQGKVLSVL